MDEVARLLHAFGSRGKHDHVAWKLDILMDLGRICEPRVVPFLADVVADLEEPPAVRRDALGRLREAATGPGQPAAREVAASACLTLLRPQEDECLRLQAALVVGDFTDVPGVLAALGLLAQDPTESIELRYNAFTSLQRAGPTSECLALLRALAADETLGQSATALLASWGAR
jgi:hypothetical protein